MKRITVFCGSNGGTDEIFRQQATVLGETLARNGIELVYGGAKIGLMGAVADAVLNNGGNAIGVIPEFLRTKEVAHDDLTSLILVKTMHERKTIMNDLCDGVIAMPGGFGTLEELFEMLTWSQLGLHKKPVGLLNVAGYYDSLLELLKNMTYKGFLKDVYYKMLLTSDNVDDLLSMMHQYVAPTVEKWISEETL